MTEEGSERGPKRRAYLIVENRCPRYRFVLGTPVLGAAVYAVFSTLKLLAVGTLGRFGSGDIHIVVARDGELEEE